jgi:3D (Asp-Asp-Asp) domain-containing protein
MIEKEPRKISRRRFIEEIGAFVAGAAAGGFAGKEITEKNTGNVEAELEKLKEEIAELKAEMAKLMQEKEKAEKRAKELEEEISKLKETKPIEPKKLKVIATAYTAGPESTGKTPEHPEYGITFCGWKADIGVVAVDPNVIELGSIVYVPGYGYAIALDRGGAIEGNRIDLFFHDLQKALEWGSREVEIVVIGKIENFELITEKLKGLGLAK